ncbi:MAG: hypothetical protein V1689_02210 [Pseudomonadota bacterium]
MGSFDGSKGRLFFGAIKIGMLSSSIGEELGISPYAVTKSIVYAPQLLEHEDIEEHLLESQ